MNNSIGPAANMERRFKNFKVDHLPLLKAFREHFSYVVLMDKEKLLCLFCSKGLDTYTFMITFLIYLTIDNFTSSQMPKSLFAYSFVAVI